VFTCQMLELACWGVEGDRAPTLCCVLLLGHVGAACGCSELNVCTKYWIQPVRGAGSPARTLDQSILDGCAQYRANEGPGWLLLSATG
jgi:hypothetical protein